MGSLKHQLIKNTTGYLIVHTNILADDGLRLNPGTVYHSLDNPPALSID
jgi:hypothetical protein